MKYTPFTPSQPVTMIKRSARRALGVLLLAALVFAAPALTGGEAWAQDTEMVARAKKLVVPGCPRMNLRQMVAYLVRDPVWDTSEDPTGAPMLSVGGLMRQPNPGKWNIKLWYRLYPEAELEFRKVEINGKKESNSVYYSRLRHICDNRM